MVKFLVTAAVAALISGAALAEDIKVGVTPGEHAQIMEKVREIAAEKGLNIEILEFSDYVVPNQALADGDLNANSFQHKPYLDNQIADRGFDLVPVAKTITTPMGVYSKKVKSLSELADGATVGIPNDPTNGGRALLILEKEGLIKVNPDAGLKAGPADVTENPKNLQFAELDAAQLPRSLDDVDAAVINTNYALEAGLHPNTDAIAIEGTESPYANLIVVRSEDKDAEWVKTLVESYNNDTIKDFINEEFKGALIPSW
ncbi:metal ABC transporter substrate-binding protein [Nitratireductor aestuarii]|uniref:Metal ABC transporter substrate-binding protein n=1 Tax=Nitratireductor aestuarii TaxID=1735103 RepID=A0A916RQD9_9HYPH|nr:MetQ/NlpA family ABC transporter substrate-binding protein [Nitratireductor aestuarii]GGA66113.1 metal ABC transporter substrate-binding protein [Nitratireductor aestuarii]